MTKILGNKNVAILHDNSTYAQGLAEWTKKYLEERGVNVVFYDAINPADKDFTPTLTKLKGANAETVYFTGYHAQGGLLLKQAPEVGLKIQWMMGNACNNPELIQIAGVENAKGGIGNIPGAMLGGMILGIIESLGAGYISPQWKDVIAYVLLALILIARPTGLLGERVAEKL
ncbi:MAG: ABC transporter substrate-binding protein [Anaerolineae bacterium]